MNLNFKNRSAPSKMLLVLSLGVAIALLPFTFIRFIQEDWLVALLDACVVLIMFGIFAFVYKTDNVKVAGLILIICSLAANVISFYIKGISQVYWIYPAMLSAYYVMRPIRGVLVNCIMLSFYLPKLFNLLDAVDLATILITIIITNIVAYVFASGLRDQAVVLKKIASVDYLTNTGNRRALDIQLSKVFNLLKNHDNTASLVLIDLDHFKEVNDKHGHLVGDKVLVDLTNLLRVHINNQADIFRYGGEEFIVIYKNVGIQDAFILAEIFRNTIKENIKIAGKEVTISLGVAEYQKDESIDEWIHRVDLALYQAKNQGRDRTIKAN